MIKIAIVSFTSPPIMTGPSFTGFERAKFLASKGYCVDLYYPYPNERWQRKNWNKVYSIEEYQDYLRFFFGCASDSFITITIACLPASYFSLMRCFDYSYSDYISIYKQRYWRILLEDGFQFFFSIRNMHYIKKYDVRIVNIVQTYYFAILPRAVRYQIITYASLFAFMMRKNIATFFIAPHLVPKLFAKMGNTHSVGNFHALRGTYHDYTKTPATKRCYLLCKLHDKHKNFSQILKWTRGICEVDVFGDGPDKKKLGKFAHCHYKGVVSDPKTAVCEYGIYLSASRNEGVCTAHMEALAMNKLLLIADAPCNQFLNKHENVYFFRNEIEFKSQLRFLLYEHPGAVVTDMGEFSWHTANNNLLREIKKMPHARIV